MEEEAEVEIEAPKKKAKHDLKPLDIQRQQVEKLLQKPDKIIQIPEKTDKPKLKAPKDIVRNVQGTGFKKKKKKNFSRLVI